MTFVFGGKKSESRRKRKLLPRVLQTLFGKCTSDLPGKLPLKGEKLDDQWIGGNYFLSAF